MTNTFGTRKQKATFDFIREYVNGEEVYPTVPEIANHFNRSEGAIRSRLRYLEEDGFIELTKGKIKIIRRD